MSEVLDSSSGIQRETILGSIGDLASQKLLNVLTDEVEVASRLGIVEILLREGVTPAAISGVLNWHEFEQFCARVLEENGFKVWTNVRFTHRGRRREIDIVAIRKPYILFIDCKHWRPGKSFGLKAAAFQQRARMQSALAEDSFLARNGIKGLTKLRRLALIVSLAEGSVPVIDGTPMVPIFKFNDFVLGLDRYWDDLCEVSLENSKLENLSVL